MTLTLVLLGALLLAILLLYFGRAFWAWVAPCALLLGAWADSGIESPVLFAHSGLK